MSTRDCPNPTRPAGAAQHLRQPARSGDFSTPPSSPDSARPTDPISGPNWPLGHQLMNASRVGPPRLQLADSGASNNKPHDSNTGAQQDEINHPLGLPLVSITLAALSLSLSPEPHSPPNSTTVRLSNTSCLGEPAAQVSRSDAS